MNNNEYKYYYFSFIKIMSENQKYYIKKHLQIALNLMVKSSFNKNECNMVKNAKPNQCNKMNINEYKYYYFSFIKIMSENQKYYIKKHLQIALNLMVKSSFNKNECNMVKNAKPNQCNKMNINEYKYYYFSFIKIMSENQKYYIKKHLQIALNLMVKS